MIAVTVHIEPEHMDPEGQFEDADTIAWIRRESEHNPWAWCTVEVRATIEGISCSDYLGGCSYRDEAEFRAGEYFEDMVRSATADLRSRVMDAYNACFE